MTICKSRSTAKHHRERISIVLKSSQGESQIQIAGDLGLNYETVRLWRNRWITEHPVLTEYEQGIGGAGVPNHKLVQQMLLLLSDAPRKGAP